MKRSALAWLLLFSFILAACNLPRGNAVPTDNPDAVYTAAAQTVQAKLQENTAVPPLPTNAQQEEPTEAPTVMPTQESTATAVPSPTPTSKPCDMAGFEKDVTIEDGTVFLPGTTFTKTWRLKKYRYLHLDEQLCSGI